MGSQGTVKTASTMLARSARATSTRSTTPFESPFTHFAAANMAADFMEGIETVFDGVPRNQTSPLSFASDDTSPLWSAEDSSQTTAVSSVNSPPSSFGQTPDQPIDLTGDDDDDMFIDLAVDALAERLETVNAGISFESGDDQDSDSVRSVSLVPECPLLGESLLINDSSVVLGKSVELTNGSFLLVEQVMDESAKTTFHGRLMVNSTSLDESIGLPRVRGELIWKTSKRFGFDIVTTVTAREIKRIRPVKFTNDRPLQWLPHSDLICRLKFTQTDKGESRDPQSNQPVAQCNQEFAVEWLTLEEVNSAGGIGKRSKELRDHWRGHGATIPFGSKQLPSVPTIDLDHDNSLPPLVDLDEDRNRTYTFGDAYCGAGGASSGAKLARLALTWAIDKDKNAVQTYRTNFPESLVEHSEFNHFMTNSDADLRVDVCHTSPPCQPFSPAHTIANEVRDELNSSCIFTSRDLIMKVRPRILTMEETFGLQGRHRETFNRVIMDFIEVGYSVRWGILDCANYGVPQMRRRLIIIAAGPGERLPKLPSPTHGAAGSCLLPFETIANAISDIPVDASDHDVAILEERSRFAFRSPYDANQPAHTLTCSGGQANYHPSGIRGLTVREAACLQTFPTNFQLCGSSRRKQVGNAVPPRFAQAIFREVFRSLRQTDEKELNEMEC